MNWSIGRRRRHGRGRGRGHGLASGRTVRSEATAVAALSAAAVAGIAALLGDSRPAGAITINPTYTASVTSNPNSAAIQNAFNYVCLQYKNLYSDPINVNISVVVGTTGLGGSSTSILGTHTYAQARTAMITDSSSANDATAVASLPVADPTPAGSLFAYPRAEAKALNIFADDLTNDGTFTFNGNFGFSFDPANRTPAAGNFDFIGVAEHEVSEIMGRIPSLGHNFFGQTDYFPFDLFRWTGPNARNLSDAAGVYFSLDSGVTNLKGFNFANGNGSDPQDWASGANDAYNAFGSSGVVNFLTPVDVTAMDVIGYNLTNLVWTGAADNTSWNIFNTSNWSNGASAKFTDAALVVFNDTSAAAANNVTLNQTVFPTSVSVSSSVNNFTISGTGAIAGPATLNKSGSSTLILANNNSYTGGTSISGGTLQVGNGGTTGSITGNVVNNATLAFSRSDAVAFPGVISGTGNLTQLGVGTVTLSGANTYSGGSTVRAGTLRLGTNNAAGTGALTMIGGTFDLNGFNQTVSGVTFGDGSATTAGLVSGAGTMTIATGGNITFNGAAGNATPPAVISSNVSLATGAHTIFNVGVAFSSGAQYDLFLQGTVSGSGGLTKAGSAAFNAALTHAGNTYTGATTINSGILYAATTNALPTSTPVVLNGGILSLNPPVTQGAVVAGNYSQSIGSLSGTSNVELGSATLTVGNDNTSTAFSGLISGIGGSLSKVGAGTLNITFPPTYTGATSVSGGNLALGANLLTTSSVTVTGGTLELTPLQTRVLRSPAITVSGTGRINIQDNKIITAAPIGTAVAGSYNGMTGLIQLGRNGNTLPLWDGSVGIVTSQAAATGGNFTSIGIATAGQVKSIAATATATWAGQTVTGSDTLVMYTYGGDANLDGKINVDDYGRIDFNVNLGTSGWYNGDFNYDGKINVDDYGIIDFNVGIQGAAFSTAGGGGSGSLGAGGFAGDGARDAAAAGANLGGVAAVPEPGSITFAIGASSLLMAGRRRRGRSGGGR